MHYYNIKIKSNGGEYCLASQDREITEREMDLYFGTILGASEEFMEKIKKVKINRNVKSINDFDMKSKREEFTFSTNLPPKNQEFRPRINFSKDEFENIENPDIKTKDSLPIAEELVFKPTQPEEELVFKKEPEIVEKEPEAIAEAELVSQAEPVSQAKPVVQPEPIIQAEPISQPEPKEEIAPQAPRPIQEEPKIVQEEIKEEAKPETPEIVSIKPQAQEEIKETPIAKIPDDPKISKTIELVQNAIKDIDISSDETFDIDLPDTYQQKVQEDNADEFDFSEEEEKEIESITESKPSSNTYTDYEVLEVELKTREIPSVVPQSEIPIEKPANNVAEFEFAPDDDDSNIIDLDKEINKTKEQAPIIQEEPPKEEEITSIFSNDNKMEAPPESQNIIAAKEFPEEKKNFNLDFKVFLSNYQHNGLIDEFLICSYYIKHVLGQENFNLKYINSKLFQSTGNIADHAVVNNLIEGGFIKTIDVDGSKKYSITTSGEEYFHTSYQR